MSNQQKVLLAQADRILKGAGCKTDGRPKSDKRESLRAISIPCGGRADRRR